MKNNQKAQNHNREKHHKICELSKLMKFLVQKAIVSNSYKIDKNYLYEKNFTIKNISTNENIGKS